VIVFINPLKRRSAMPKAKLTKKPQAPAVQKPLKIPITVPKCSKTFEFFKNITVSPGQSHDSMMPKDVDCYQWLHVWVLAHHPANKAMDNITVELVFELPAKMGATGLANLELPYTADVQPTPLRVNSGVPKCGYGGFVIRAPIIGPGVRVILINGGAETYSFTVWGYATH
jgi:hypothetical protein